MAKKLYRTIARAKNTEDEWRHVTYYGENFACEEAQLSRLKELTHVMSTTFPNNEYLIEEVKINVH